METTLALLIKDNKILLGLKKRGFGEGKYNGIGGKLEKGETPEMAMIRETQEEIHVTPTKYEYYGILNFDEIYKGQKSNVTFHLYLVYDWNGTISESDEEIPKWFELDKIPFDKMFPDDKYWLPLVLNGQKIRAYFNFDENWNVLYKEIADLNQNVTIVLDGQAGSCGKGKFCGYIAQKDNFDISTNNWGSNAGHTYVEDNGRKVIVSHIPMAVVNPKTKLIINAGALITPEKLFEEIEEYSDLIGNRKIYIDKRAMIIEQRHRDYEKENIRSGSTFEGVGAALADKTMRSKDVKLAEQYFENYDGKFKNKIEIIDSGLELNNQYGKILVEGSQGADLDINHGLKYPNTTSRQTSSSQLIADAGLNPFKVKNIYMIIRPYPIRISNSTNIGQNIYSGDYAGSNEISWEEVSKSAGFNGQLEEYTTVTKKKRRVFEMNWERLKYNCMINGPTGIVLNFAQYIDWEAYKCKNYKELPPKVINFIKKVEEVTNVPVVMIGTGEKNEDIIDLRKSRL